MRKVLYLLPILTLLSLQLFAQHQKERPARLLTVVPFQQLSGGVVVMKGLLNDYPDSLNFILDTGSGGISLDSTTAYKLNLPLSASDRTIRGIGGIKTVKFHNNGKLRLQNLHVDSLNFHINDYELLTSVYGIKIDGIIGFSFISRYILKLDYDSAKMYVYSQGKYRYGRAGYMMHPQFGSIPIQPLSFKDEKRMEHKFYFDTGAGLCFLLSESYVNDSNVMRTNKAVPVATQAEGLGGKMLMKLTTVKEVNIGPYKFKDVPTYIFEDKYNVTNYPDLGGLLGNDLLRRFTVVLNYGKREIHLLPNSNFRAPFDYSYTGLGVYYVEGKVLVEDVIKDSPGDKAGLQPGDVIIGVQNNYSNSIQAYKDLLQRTTERLKLLILRNGEPFEVFLKPKNILKG
jgi:predicted aspartyl protease